MGEECHVILLTAVGHHRSRRCWNCVLSLPVQSGASLTLGRSRLSSLNRRTESHSYDHNAEIGGPPIVLVSPLVHGSDPMDTAQAQPASSFAFVEFESSSEEEDDIDEDGFISAAPPNYIDVVGDAPPRRPVSLPPVDVGAGERLDISRNRASAYVMTSEPIASVGVAARAAPTQRQDPGFVYDVDEGYQYYLNFIKVCDQRGLHDDSDSNRVSLRM